MWAWVTLLRASCPSSRSEEGTTRWRVVNEGPPLIWIALVRLRDLVPIANRGEGSVYPGLPLTCR